VMRMSASLSAKSRGMAMVWEKTLGSVRIETFFSHRTMLPLIANV
jgi:hypothetical protein